MDTLNVTSPGHVSGNLDSQSRRSPSERSNTDALTRPQRGERCSEPLSTLLDRVPIGWTRVVYNGRPYGLARTEHAGGRSVSIYAEELGGNDLVSANVYRTQDADCLRACEMPDAKVLAFLRGWSPG